MLIRSPASLQIQAPRRAFLSGVIVVIEKIRSSKTQAGWERKLKLSQKGVLPSIIHSLKKKKKGRIKSKKYTSRKFMLRISWS